MKTAEELKKKAMRLEALADILESLETTRSYYEDKANEYSAAKYEAYGEVIALISNAIK